MGNSTGLPTIPVEIAVSVSGEIAVAYDDQRLDFLESAEIGRDEMHANLLGILPSGYRIALGRLKVFHSEAIAARRRFILARRLGPTGIFAKELALGRGRPPLQRFPLSVRLNDMRKSGIDAIHATGASAAGLFAGVVGACAGSDSVDIF